MFVVQNKFDLVIATIGFKSDANVNDIIPHYLPGYI